jgi:pescadillo protein
MMNFEEFYEELLKFINFKLFKDLGFEYPIPEMSNLNLASNVVFSNIQSFIHKTQEHLKQKSLAASPESQPKEGVNKGLDQFKQFRFYVNREVPIYSLELILLAAGCQVGYDEDNSPFDESVEGITHQIVDRPLDPEDMKSNREYVQPQWVFDCLNNSIILPAAHYAPGKTPPAHLSPFVDNSREGYIPTRQKEINQLKGVEEEVQNIESDQEIVEEEEEKKEEIKEHMDEELSDEEITEEKDKAKAMKIKK